MDYPVWHLPGISKGLLLGVISVLHVFVAQFAVGGGLFLVFMERKAHKSNNSGLLDWLERHTRFFLLLTMVFGGLSGVGIWFTMSVIAPSGTAILAHTFLFLWAAEWTFFLTEIAALLAYYYTYSLCRKGFLSAETHMRMGWVYAVSGFMSLFFINGIITFMLTPGESLSTGNLWHGFFNPTFWPSLFFRTALCLMLAGMFGLLTAHRIDDEATRREAVRDTAKWICLPFIVFLASAWLYVNALPADRLAAMWRRTQDIRPFLLSFGWILPVVFIGGVLAYARAQRLRGPLTVLILCSGLVLAGSFEWIRESSRRPFIIPHYMYSNDMFVSDRPRASNDGLAAHSGWADLHASGKGTRTYGAFLFDQQCASCHGFGAPRIDVLDRVAHLTPQGLAAQLEGQGSLYDYMPPFFGNENDKKALIDHLQSGLAAGNE